MDGINLDILNAHIRKLKGYRREGVTVDDGDYTVRLVAIKQATGRRSRPLKIAIFEITEGAYRGRRIETPVWGNAERLVTSSALPFSQFSVQVYTHHEGKDREYGRVNIEAIRPIALPLSVPPPPTECTGAPVTLDRVLLAAAGDDFTRGFQCCGSTSAPRQVIDWRESYAGMARRDEEWLAGDVVYFSTFTYTGAIQEHQAKNDLDAVARGKRADGSLRNFGGPCFAPFLTFDTDCRDADGNPDPAGCQFSAIDLVIALLELGVAQELIWPFYSGSKGFHVQFPSMCAATVPSDDYHLIAKEFCTSIADRAGVTIDPSLYRKLQPLRAPNSIHEKTGLYKVRLSLDELIELPFEKLRELAKRPRTFQLPSYVSEPVPELVKLWQQAIQRVRTAQVPVAGSSHEESASRITAATWDYLINGAAPGSRADSHFKAAANLADFDSLKQLVHELMRRPAAIDGWSAHEAETHVESALRRAVSRRDVDPGTVG